MVSAVRVFLPTYKRPKLLRRALECLVAQDFDDWVCELHNDCPEDAASVDNVVAGIGDRRFEVVHHRSNLGGTRSFNLIFESRHEEPFFSILEDDNYWDPDFLSTMVAAMEKFPDVAVGWANQRVEVEAEDGTFVDIGKVVGPAGQAPCLRPFGDFRQVCGNLHSNGAMIVRTAMSKGLSVPPNLPFVVIEMFRDRVFPYPLLYIPKPMAVFSVTHQTSRSPSTYEWTLLTSLAAGSFLKFCEGNLLADVFAFARAHVPPTTNALLLGLLLHGRPGLAVRTARIGDWLLLIRTFLRRPYLARMFVARATYKEWQEFLDKNTLERFREKARSTASSPL